MSKSCPGKRAVSSFSPTSTPLRKIVRDLLLSEVFEPMKDVKGKKILVVDQHSLRVISASFTLDDIIDENIVLIESLLKRREPLPSMDVVYMIAPLKDSISHIISDFDSGGMYRAAHVFLAWRCGDDIIRQLGRSHASRHIQTLKEVDMPFIPYEKRVFLINEASVFRSVFRSQGERQTAFDLDRISERIASMCAALGEYPHVRIREFGRNRELGRLLQQALEDYKAENLLGDGKRQTQLLIIDRGFDCVSPLLHELTFQAMCQDLLNLENDIYHYELKGEQGGTREVKLDENDEMWVQNRHKHIAVLNDEMIMLAKKHKAEEEKNATKKIATLLKQMPQYLKETDLFRVHYRLTEECMKKYKEGVNKLCKAEQDLATQQDSEGQRIKEPVQIVSPLLSDNNISCEDKARLLMLSILSKDGVPEATLDRLLQYAGLDSSWKETIMNASFLGQNIVIDNGKKKTWNPKRWNRPNEHVYLLSRWDPVLKDIMEDAIDGKLDEAHFPYLSGKRDRKAFRYGNPVSARAGQYNKEKSLICGNAPRLIIYVLGGVTYSEMRAAYEVSAAKNCEVIIGSDQVLTPEKFLSNLSSLGTRAQWKGKCWGDVNNV